MSTTVSNSVSRTVRQKLSEQPSVLDFNAGGSDDTVRFQRALSWANSEGGRRLYVPRAGYIVSDTLQLPSSSEIYGDWSKLGAVADPAAGTRIKWAGPANMPILRAFDTHGLHLHHLQIHGGQIAGCTGLLIDSDNAPTSSGNSYDHLQFCYVGAPPLPDHFAVDGTAIKIGSTVTTNEMDATWFRNVQIYLCHTGYRLASWNSGQGMYILGGEISYVTHGIHIDTTGGLLSVTNCFGSLVGLPNGTDECAWIYIKGFHSNLIFNQCQVEAGFGKFLLVAAGIDGATSGSEIYLNGCVMNHASDIRSERRVFIHGGVSTSDIVLSGDNITVVVESIQMPDPGLFSPNPYALGHVAVTNGSPVVKLVIGGYLAASCTAAATLLQVASFPYDYVVGQLYVLDNEAVQVTALTDATHVTVARAQNQTAAAAHAAQVFTLYANVNTPGGWQDYQDRGVMTIGGVDYTFHATGFMAGTLTPNYAGATNPAIAYSMAIPVRDIISTGVDNLIYRIGPQSGGSMQDIDNVIEGFPSLRLRALNGVQNPSMQFLNGTQKWDILYPSAAGLVPNGICFFNETTGIMPFGIYPNAPANSLILGPAGPLLAPAFESVTVDRAPSAWPQGRFYFALVFGMPTMDAANLNGYPSLTGSIFGFGGDPASSIPDGYGYQTFHDTTSRYWFRTAVNGTTWGPWRDLTSGGPISKDTATGNIALSFNLSGSGSPLPAGLYRVNWYLVITTGGTGTSVGVGVSWNDGTQIYSGAITSTGPGFGLSQSGSKVFRDAGVGVAALNVIFNGITAAPTYTVYYSVETLN